MNTVTYNRHRDFPMIRDWWTTRGMTPPSYDFLVNGMIAVDDEQEPIAAMFFLDVVGSPMTWISFVIVKPSTPPPIAHDAIMQCANAIADARPKRYLFASFANGLVPTLERCGFTVTETGKTELVRRT